MKFLFYLSVFTTLSPSSVFLLIFIYSFTFSSKNIVLPSILVLCCVCEVLHSHCFLRGNKFQLNILTKLVSVDNIFCQKITKKKWGLGRLKEEKKSVNTMDHRPIYVGQFWYGLCTCQPSRLWVWSS